MSERCMLPQLFKEESHWSPRSWKAAYKTASALLYPETAFIEMFAVFQHYLLTPYNGCIVARNINRSITCLIVQSKNGVGFNPCHLSLATDLKLAHWTAVAHAHMTLKHEHLIYSLVDFRSLYSFQATWDHGFGQLISSCIRNTSKNCFFQHFHAASFPDGGFPRPELVTVKVAFSYDLNEAFLHTLKPLRWVQAGKY